MRLAFTVFGTPQPQGSMRAFIPKGGKFPVVTADNAKMKPWRQQIAWTALAERARAGQGAPPSPVPICLQMVFYFSRPKSAKKSIMHKLTKPDLDKLQRAVLDALTGVLFKDDSQVVGIHAQKLFGQPERMEIEVTEVGSCD